MSASLRALMAASAVVVGGVALIGGAGTAFASQHGGDDHKVSSCHVTGINTNSHNLQSINVASAFKDGHDGHSHKGRTATPPDCTTTPTEAPEVPETAAPTTAAPTTVVEEPEQPEGPATTEPTEPTDPTEPTEPEVTVPTPDTPETEVSTTAAVAETAAAQPSTSAATQATVTGTGRLPETGAGTIGLIAGGAGALVLGLGLVQLTSVRRRAVEAD
jgi:outer membrane biosynthesis protein TonB